MNNQQKLLKHSNRKQLNITNMLAQKKSTN